VQTQTIALPTQQAVEAVQQVKDTYGNAVQSASAQASQGEVAQPDSSAQIIDLPNDTTHF
jgi:hypothetical protein